MRILHLDSPSGVSGELLLGAFCDLGVTPSTIDWELGKLPLGDFHLHFERELCAEIEGVRFSIHEGATHTHEQDEPAHDHGHAHEDGCGCEHDHDHHHHDHEHGHDHHEHEDDGDDEEGVGIDDVLDDSELSDFVKAHARSIFGRLGEDEGFGEEDALSAIAQVVGACVGIEQLGIEQIARMSGQSATPIAAAIVAEFDGDEVAISRVVKVGYGVGKSERVLKAELTETR